MSSISGMKTARQPNSNRETADRAAIWALGVLLAAMGLWAYGPTIQEIIAAWNSNPDYSHGYFVLPLAALFLYLRRASCPTSVLTSFSWIGLLILCVVGLMRYASARLYLPEADAWS